MARTIAATPTLTGKDAEEFIRKMIQKQKGKPTKKDIEIFHNIMFMKDRKTPRCHICGKAMHNVKDSVTGKMSPYLWKCDCPGFPKNMIMSVG